jgi:hypothetical protein
MMHWRSGKLATWNLTLHLLFRQMFPHPCPVRISCVPGSALTAEGTGVSVKDSLSAVRIRGRRLQMQIHKQTVLLELH